MGAGGCGVLESTDDTGKKLFNEPGMDMCSFDCYFNDLVDEGPYFSLPGE